jgi:AraC-like DNA-binding protein
MKVPDAEIQVHLGCFSYGKNKDVPQIEIKHYEKKTTIRGAVSFNYIVVVYKGALDYFLGKTRNKKIAQGSFFMLPAKQDYVFEITKDSTLIVFHLGIDLNFCDHFSFEMLYKEKKNGLRKKEEKIYVLSANHIIQEFFTLLVNVLNDGLYCSYLLALKMKEFLYLLRYYYPMQELKAFFNPILSDDLDFSLHVMQNYNPKITVNELAKKMFYSLTGFEKRFKKVFGVSPSNWLCDQRTQVIYHEINCSTKTLSELGYEFGFSSPSHFNNFCKKMFNETPGNIRKKY